MVLLVLMGQHDGMMFLITGMNLTVGLSLVSVSLDKQPAWQGDLNSSPLEPQTGLKASRGQLQAALQARELDLRTGGHI